jgi:thioredoxin-like negative regulator of GroEL
VPTHPPAAHPPTHPPPPPQGHGQYTECHDQKQFFDDLKKEARAVVHFYRPATRRCEVVDKHLTALARKHLETKFLRVDAEKSPFLAERLKIWMLPTLVLVKQGRTEHSIVGFDELGGSDNFTTAQLEQLLLQYDVLTEAFMG